MRLLVSVRNVEEALCAARGGADFIDLKEPGQGALGGLPADVILEVVSALRRNGIGLPVSATIGDLPMDHAARLQEMLARVLKVGACGVDYVKVGIEPAREGGVAWQALDVLAGCGLAVVPVFLADRGIDFEQLRHAGRLGFPAIMAAPRTSSRAACSRPCRPKNCAASSKRSAGPAPWSGWRARCAPAMRRR